jgi:hypothetical protein
MALTTEASRAAGTARNRAVDIHVGTKETNDTTDQMEDTGSPRSSPDSERSPDSRMIR